MRADLEGGHDRCILVTGANGFVGRWLLRKLASASLPPTRIIAAHQEATVGCELYKPLDVTSRYQATAIIRDVQPTAIIHLAAISAVSQARLDPRRTWEVNLYGTMNLAEAVQVHAPKARFIFASTSEVYGAAFIELGKAVDEHAPLYPTNPYATSKAAADLLIGQMARDGLRAVRFRPFNHTGPGQSDRFVIPSFASQIAKIEAGLQPPILRVGNLDVARDFVDVRDIINAYSRAAVSEGDLEPGVVINLASGVPRRIGDILEALCKKSKVPIQVRQDTERLRPNDVPLVLGDATRAKVLLDWTPQIAWNDTLDHILEYFRRRIAAR